MPHISRHILSRPIHHVMAQNGTEHTTSYLLCNILSHSRAMISLPPWHNVDKQLCRRLKCTQTTNITIRWISSPVTGYFVQWSQNLIYRFVSLDTNCWFFFMTAWLFNKMYFSWKYVLCLHHIPWGSIKKKKARVRRKVGWWTGQSTQLACWRSGFNLQVRCSFPIV